ncbi:MAG: GTP cyclohydrolase I FolE [Eubacterium sp.]|nr:GTP cyclohydrolase I FolE [Eubacterium sp.]
MDKKKIEEAVRLFLEGIGEDVSREGLVDTPKRVSAMCDEIFGGYEKDAKEPLSKVFTSETTNMVVEKDIRFYSVCEHHLLPFFGTVSIGYIPGEKVVGLSKLARTVEVYARRAQIQEKMTAQIASAIQEELNPRGVIVLAKAEHMCMSMRGVSKPGTTTVTYKTTGVFDTDDSLKEHFFKMLEY